MQGGRPGELPSLHVPINREAKDKFISLPSRWTGVLKMQAQTGIDGSIVRREFAKGTSRYWLIPPEIYRALDDEFHFTFDPFPYPRPEGWDAIKMDWGASNFVNPPFNTEGKVGLTAYVRKAIEENKKGKTVVLTLPVYHYVNLLLEAGVEIRPLGRIAWIDPKTGKGGCKNSNALYILKGSGRF